MRQQDNTMYDTRKYYMYGASEYNKNSHVDVKTLNNADSIDIPAKSFKRL